MRVMLRLLACALLLAGPAGCASAPLLSLGCRNLGERELQDALRAAPAHVALRDGSRLSTCIERATNDSDLQTLGKVYTGAGDRLVRTAVRDPRSALRLGYLEGATERGASRTNGTGAELVNRMGHLLALEESSPAARTAFIQGRTAGLADG